MGPASTACRSYQPADVPRRLTIRLREQVSASHLACPQPTGQTGCPPEGPHFPRCDPDGLPNRRRTSYIGHMAKAHPTTTSTTVRDSKTGRLLTVRGIGALKGHLTLNKGVDLTKPIASQAIKVREARKEKAPKKQ